MLSDFKESIQQAIKYWWISLVIGVISIGLGAWAIAAPITMLFALTIVFVASFAASGVMNIVFAVSNRKTLKNWGWSLASGVFDIAIAMLLMVIPASTIFVLLMFVGLWVMLQALWGFGVTYEMQQAGIKGWGWTLTLSILALLFSFILMSNPAFAAGFIIYLAAISLVMYGVLRVYYAFKLKSLKV